jgi:hypothetical protein
MLKRIIFIIAVVYAGSAWAKKVILSQQNFYAGQKSEFTIQQPKLTGVVNWRLTFFGRFSESGKFVANANEARIEFKAPNLNPGVTVKGKFTVKSSSKTFGFPIYLYSQEPFIDKAEFNKLKICVWNLGQDANWIELLLKKHGITFKQTDNFDNFDGDVLLISGIDFNEFSGIAENLFNWCKNGKRIIILAPILGLFPLPSEAFEEFSAFKSTAIHKFNKKFELLPTLSTFKHASSDELSSLDFSKKQNGYSFCRIKHGRGEIILCGWDIQGKLKTNPTALYFFKILLTKK